MTARKRIAIVGAGICGTMTAYEALRLGYEVEIYSEFDLQDTTSAKAAANFKPHVLPDFPGAFELVAESWTGWERILHDHGLSTGIRLHTHWEAMSAEKPLPFYSSIVREFEFVAFPHVPGGYAFGWRYSTFFIDMSIFSGWLTQHLLANGVTFHRRSFANLEQFASLNAEIVINCSGLGAKALTGDASLIPSKGQLAILGPRRGMDWSISADGFYIYPRLNETILGGTDELGVGTQTVDQNVIDLIVRANKRIMPDITGSNVLRSTAGFRPYRKSGPRTEREVVDSILILHNYGHGGSGITLAPGSAKSLWRI